MELGEPQLSILASPCPASKEVARPFATHKSVSPRRARSESQNLFGSFSTGPGAAGRAFFSGPVSSIFSASVGPSMVTREIGHLRLGVLHRDQ